ncbi:MAG TPA: alpha/beta hydrolase [Phycisphaerae bacterium]|nr:alpha/beta hydrolase [Phycisphaerae bacterium]
MGTIRTDWGQMACRDAGGAGPAVLLLHGTGCDSSDWAAVLRELPPGVRAVTMDFRGHGRSSIPAAAFELPDLADDVLRLIRELGPARVLLVGHSLGGMVAMEAARRCPAVAGLVLLEGWTRLSAAGAFDGDRFYGTLPRAAVDRIQRKSEQTRRRFPPALWDHFWHSLERFDGCDYLRTARIPIIEVYGDMGRTDRTEALLGVPDNPCIEWIWIPGAGHYLPHESPRQVARACSRGIEKTVYPGD